MAYEKAVCRVYVDGTNIMPALLPVLISLRVSDRAGKASGTATIDVDDAGGQIIFPRVKARMLVFLGWEGGPVDLVFDGFVDSVRSQGGRGGGRTLTIGAKEVDTTGKPKQGHSRHFDNATLKDIIEKVGKASGITDFVVEETLAAIKIPYLAMRGESFLALGQRLARELGATFKVVGTRATMVPRNGTSAFPVITAAWGDNLIDWSIEPFRGRPRFKRTKARYYDKKQAKWIDVETETDLEDADADADSYLDEPDEETATRRTKSRAKESEREAGSGSVTIDGNTVAQPEATCMVVGARPGVDGAYRIDTVDHTYSRSGFTTSLGLKRPGSETGKDDRDKKPAATDNAGEEPETYLDEE